MKPHTKVAAAGFALILATNAIAIGGALYNRRGEPESRLMLTDRELGMPYSWEWHEENSGLSLRIEWRAVRHADEDGYYLQGRQASWLDAAKLEALGFDTSLPPDDLSADRHYERHLSRDALLVLELDGPAYAEALKAAEQRLKEAEAEAAALPKERHERDLRSAREALHDERERNSRLFVVDAGTELRALREQYPDKTRYAIVRGHVDIDVCTHKTGKRLCGSAGDIEVARINVPVELRPVFAGIKANNRFDRDEPRVPYTTVVAFGRRLEPWLVSAERPK